MVKMMKELSELYIPRDRSYTEDHVWARVDGDVVVVGVSDYAQDQMGKIVSVELPDEGDEFEQGDEFGLLKSSREEIELYIPVSGRVLAVNEDLLDEPELLNIEPNDAWIVELEPFDLGELDDLMTSFEYLDILED